MAQSLKSQHRLPLKRPAESRLHPNLIIYNTYVTWKDNNSSEFGWIFSTKSGRKVDQGSTLAPIISSPLMAEATVVFLAIQHAHNLGVNHLYIASDSSQLIKALHSEVQHKELHEILNDIFSISFNFVVISFNFSPQDANRLANSLAKDSLFSLTLDEAQSQKRES